VVAHKPAGMTLAMHLCRGNFKSTHAASGNYEPVAEALLSEMNLDAYFLEYDDDRSGDFRRCASSSPRARSSCWAW
jgi:5-methyltetrahydropteroyltriglutamate--homocysteine methyltransferase